MEMCAETGEHTNDINKINWNQIKWCRIFLFITRIAANNLNVVERFSVSPYTFFPIAQKKLLKFFKLMLIEKFGQTNIVNFRF